MAGPVHACNVRGMVGTGSGSFPVRDGHRVLHEMIRATDRSIPIGCRGGGCGACRIRVVNGRYTTLRMSRAHVSPDDEAAGVVLACRLVPTSDIVVELAPASAEATPTEPAGS